MAYTLTVGITLGSGNGGLTLSAQLKDTAGANVGGAVATGFVDLTVGLYSWTYAAFPDGFRGMVVISSAGVAKAAAAINPEEAEHTDVKTSSRLASAVYSVAPSAAAVADQVWDETAADHVAVGSTGKKLSDAGSASDPLLNTVPGSYASGTAGAALGRITAAALTVVSPVAESGDVSVIRGDDYLAANGRALDWSSVDWPTLTGGTIAFNVKVLPSPVWTKAGTVTAPTAVRVELTAADTVAIGVGTYDFDIQATVATVVTTLVRGVLQVSGDVR